MISSFKKSLKEMTGGYHKVGEEGEGEELLEMKEGRVIGGGRRIMGIVQLEASTETESEYSSEFGEMEIRRDPMDSELNAWDCPNLRTAQRVRPAEFIPRTKPVVVAEPKKVEEVKPKRRVVVRRGEANNRGCPRGAPGPVGRRHRVVRRRGRVHYNNHRRVVKVIEHHHIYHH